MSHKYLFIDRDGTLVHEPEDFQVDALSKIRLLDGVIAALLALAENGYRFVMVSNQDGLGTDSFLQQDFDRCHDWILGLFSSQGISFSDILICPHLPAEGCECRKPKTGLVMGYMRDTNWDRDQSYVIGDRESDLLLATNMGLKSYRVGAEGISWQEIAHRIINRDRTSECRRTTKETDIVVEVNLDQTTPCNIDTGIGFFDHMLEQISRHAGFSICIKCSGDTHIDDHHSVEDVGLALGQALKTALGDKRGIQRYDFLMPMDESLAQIALDLSGRPLLVFEAELKAQKVGELSTEMVPHFFRSLTQTLGATLHIKASGENSHHIVEGIFKGVAKCLGQAMMRTGNVLPSTKGVL